jgi:2-keto-4-pentenoate hydratase
MSNNQEPDSPVGKAAGQLAQARAAHWAAEPVSQALLPLGLEGAYACQAINTRLWVSEGRRPVGYKIGLTAEAAQQAFGATEPTRGVLFADAEVTDGGIIDASALFSPRVEGEIAFVIGRDIPEQNPTVVDVLTALDCVLPAIEIVDSRFGRWDVHLLDAVADNGAAGLFALGAEPKTLRDFDAKLCGMVLEVNGEPASTGVGLACLGHPLNALRWLAGNLARDGAPLRAGDVVLSGALGPMVPLDPGDHVSLRISGLGSVDFTFGELEAGAAK